MVAERGGGIGHLAVYHQVDQVLGLVGLDLALDESDLAGGLLAALAKVALVEGEAELPVLEHEVLPGAVVPASVHRGRRDHMAEAGEVVDRLFQTVEALTSGVGFVAAHNRRPLPSRHGAGAGVGQEIDENVAGGNEEEIVPGVFEVPLALDGMRTTLGVIDSPDAAAGLAVATK